MYYVYFLLKSTVFQKHLQEMSRSAQAGFNKGNLSRIRIPIPPLNEQKRIVAKVDQLMKLCDELEERNQKKRQIRVRLNQSALDHLLASSTPVEFNAQWQRICNTFDMLYDTSETISKLRRSILQLAVQGKLSTQSPNDEPASVLLEKIKVGKHKLIREKKLRETEPLLPVKPKDLLNNKPMGWEYARLGSCIELISGQHLGQEEQNVKGEGLPYLTGPADFGEINPIATRWTTMTKVIAEKNDILITVKGAGVGKSNILSLDKAAIGRQLMAIRSMGIENEYLYILVIASYDDFQSLSIGATVPGISRKDILNYLVCVPPFNEQKRIVAKVDQLMKLCGELEAKLTRSQSISKNLIASIVNHLSTTQESETARAALSR